MDALKRLEDLVSLVDDGLTKQEFEDAFEATVEHIKILENRIMSEMETLRRKYRDLSEFSSIIENVETLKAEQQDRLTMIDEKVAAVKDGAPGKDGLNGLDGKDGAPGKDGMDGINGLNGLDGVNGLNGLDGAPGKDGVNGKDAEPVDHQVIINEVLQKVPAQRVGWGAHPLVIAESGTIKAKVARHLNFTGSGVSSVTTNPDGTIDVSISGGGGGTSGGSFAEETPTGTVNGVNTIFTFVNTPAAVFLNGVYQAPTTDYTLVGTVVTFVNAPVASSIIRSLYSNGVDTLTEETPTGTVNGVNKAFVFTHTPLAVYLNGAYQAPTTDYTRFGTTVTFINAPLTGSIIRSLYLVGTAPTTTVYTETPSGTINSVNTTFTTVNSITSIFSFALNGQFVHPSEYSVAGSTITFVTAPNISLAGTSFTIIYA